METSQLSINGITINYLWIALFVILAAITIYNTVMTAKQHYNRLKAQQRAPNDAIQTHFNAVEQRLDGIDAKLASDKRRIQALQARAQRSDKEMRILLRSQMVMLHYMFDNGSKQKLIQASQEIQDFLTNNT